MILSSDELEILDYLKSWKGTSVSIMEICRCAGGRKKFRESPNWAKTLMARLVEARLVEVNDRGHYRFVPRAAPVMEVKPAPIIQGQAVGEDYFPVQEEPPKLVGDDYFPSTTDESEDNTKLWISPHIEETLRRAGKSFNDPVTE